MAGGDSKIVWKRGTKIMATWKTMSSQAGVHGLYLFDKGLLLVAIFSPGNVKSRPGEFADLVVSGLSTGFKNYYKQCFF
jgi:hypothetical protein